MSKIAFISGPLDADAEYFDEHYTPLIRAGLAEGHRFLVGDSRGIDTLAINFLVGENAASSVTVLTLASNSAKVQSRLTKLGVCVQIINGESATSKDRQLSLNDLHSLRDSYGTRNSHYDILRYRTQEECKALFGDKYRPRVSGTEKNEIRRKSGVGLKWIEADRIDLLPPASGSRLTAKEKKIKALEKKIYQANQLSERLGKGEKLEQNQLDKIGNLPVWEQELQDANNQ
ncbi:hypothetical protein BDR26DRAFT_108306 [Obelidium mucronatum]|nr:hypothetical protein BDR26DRAFT_108306 [Obelidium mucronatum]